MVVVSGSIILLTPCLQTTAEYHLKVQLRMHCYELQLDLPTCLSLTQAMFLNKFG